MPVATLNQAITQARQFGQLGDYRGVIAVLGEALKDDPTNLEGLFLHGAACFKLNMFDKARESWTRILRIDPNYDKALRWMEKLRAAESMYHLDRARSLGQAGDYKAVIRSCNDLLANNPNHVEALFLHGAACFKLHVFGRARESWERVLRIDPNFAKAKRWLEKLPKEDAPEAKLPTAQPSAGRSAAPFRTLSPDPVGIVDSPSAAKTPGRIEIRHKDSGEVLRSLRAETLENADLAGVELRGAQLSKTKLCRANLFASDLSRANLQESDLSDANLRGAILTDANLTGAVLKDANMVSAFLRGATMADANLADADLTRAVMNNSNLEGANFHDASLIDADLRSAVLTDANLSGANLESACLSSAFLRAANLAGANLAGADLTRINLSNANLEGANLEGAKLSGSFLRAANLTNANLAGADLSRSNLSSVNMEGANLTGANLTDADLGGALLIDANLTGATVAGVDLSDADLTRTILDGTGLALAEISGGPRARTDPHERTTREIASPDDAVLRKLRQERRAGMAAAAAERANGAESEVAEEITEIPMAEAGAPSETAEPADAQ